MTSPARAALAVFNNKTKDYAATCDAARAPVLEALDRIDGTKSVLHDAETKLAALQAREANEIIEKGRESPKLAQEIAAAAASVDRTRRVLAALQTKHDEMRGLLTNAETTAAIHASGVDLHVAGVVEEVASDVIAEMIADQAKAARSEAAARTLVAAIANRKWHAVAERLNARFGRPPVWGEQKFPDWLAFISSLETDSRAPVPAVPR
jgi:hypothetical protein